MIISYSRKFCFIRVPKAGSTTCALAIANSDLVDRTADYISRCMDFPNAPLANNQGLRLVAKIDPMHHRAAQYQSLGVIDTSFEVISTIRHPVDRFISLVRFAFKVPNPNLIWDMWGDQVLDHVYPFANARNRILQPQHYWFGNNATLWPVPQIDRCLAVRFGIDSVQRHRVTKTKLTEELTPDRQKQILDHYQKDLVLYEQAMSGTPGWI